MISRLHSNSTDKSARLNQDRINTKFMRNTLILQFHYHQFFIAFWCLTVMSDKPKY